MLPAREWRGGTREEYETQHFGFGSQQISIALRSVVERSIVDNVRGMETSLATSLRLNDEERTELTSTCDKLISLYLSRAGPAVKRLDSELDRIFNIPDSVVLPEDEERATRVTDTELDQLQAGVAAAESRVKRAALMEALLKVEEEELKSVEKYCDMTRQTIGALDSFSKKLFSKTDTLMKLQEQTRAVCRELPFTKNKDFL